MGKSSLLNLIKIYLDHGRSAPHGESIGLGAPGCEQAPFMTDAEDSPDELRSEVVFLPTVTCPVCHSRNVVVEIEVEQTPVLSCTACGHSSTKPDQAPG
jgi:hypothetical protein